MIADNGASYLWDFGNGQTSTAFNPTFTYNAPGTYTVNVQTEVSELALTQVNITTLGGGWGGDVEDFFGLGAPDPYLGPSAKEGDNGERFTFFSRAGIDFCEKSAGQSYFLAKSLPVTDAITMSPPADQFTIWQVTRVFDTLTTALAFLPLRSFNLR